MIVPFSAISDNSNEHSKTCSQTRDHTSNRSLALAIKTVQAIGVMPFVNKDLLGITFINPKPFHHMAGY